MYKIAVRKISFVILGLLFRVKHHNRENLPADKAFILCCNHETMLDMFFIGCWIKTWIYWMAKKELFYNPILGLALKGLGAFPVNRGKGDIDSFKTALSHLKMGKVVGIFPQGTRLKKRKGKLRIGNGAAYLAVKTNAPILPVAIKIDFKIFGRVDVTYGKPFYVSDMEFTYEKKDILNKISKRIMSSIGQLLEVGY